MRRILVLTKNILVEQTFQQQLQHLNYEVFCTNCCEETIEHELTFLIIFDCIKRNTISERLLEIIRKSFIVREADLSTFTIDV